MSRTIRYIKNKTIRTVEFEEELKKAKKNKKFDYEYVKALYVDFMSNPMNQIDRKKSKIIFCRAYNVPPGLIAMWEVTRIFRKRSEPTSASCLGVVKGSRSSMICSGNSVGQVV